MNVPQLRFKEFSGEWKKIRLEEKYPTIRNGFVGISTPYYVENGIKYLQGKNIKNGAIDSQGLIYVSKEFNNRYKKSQLKLNDIVIVQSGHVGECAVIDENYVNANCHALVILTPKNNTSVCSKFFVNYFYSSYGKRLIYQIKTGNTIEHVLASEVKGLTPFSPEYPEQTKIANFLTAVDEKIAQLTQKADLLALYKKGVMQQIFSQQLRFKDDDGREFPEWEVKSLGDVAKFRRGSFPQPYGLAKWYDDINGMPFIQVFDVDDNFRLKNKTKRKISKEAQLQSVFVEKGSILITIQGSIGRIAVTQYDAYVDRTLLLFESFKIKMNKYYFAYVLFLLFEIEKEKAPGGIIKTITKEVLTDFEVFICDYAEQTKIANFLTAIDDKISQNQTQLNALKQYKQGLLQQMFV